MSDTGRRVLLVEDNVINQKVARALLERAGHQVTVASQGADAVARIDADDYDIVLMDIQMPVMDGLEATRLIRARQRRQGAPAHHRHDRQRHGRRPRGISAAGMDEYISKPIETRRMLELVDRLGGDGRDAERSPRKPGRKTKAKPADIPAVDEAHLDSIRQVLPPREFVQLISDFLDGAHDRLARIERLSDTEDFPALFREAHDMVSTAGNFGARRVEGAARRLEAAAKNQDRPAIAEAVSSLQRESVEALAAIRERVMGVPA